MRTGVPFVRGVALASAIHLLVVASRAGAQEVPDAPSSPPPALPRPPALPGPDAPAPALDVPPPVGWWTVAPAPPLYPAPVPVKEAEGLRLGFHLNGGFGVGGGATGGIFGAAVHGGWQFDHRMAAYAQIAMFGWFSSERSSADRTTTASGVVGFQFTPLFSLMPGESFEVAAGPSFDHLLTSKSSSEASSASSNRTSSGDALAYFGNDFGMHGRFAQHVGATPSPDTGRRTSLTLAADVHPTFAEGSVLMFFTLGVGGDWY